MSQGDHEVPTETTIADLLKSDWNSSGQRVAIRSFYRREFEGDQVCDTKHQVKTFDFSHCLWLGQASDFADQNNISKNEEGYARIVGIFWRGPSGHMSGWPGEITRLTEIKILPKPSSHKTTKPQKSLPSRP